MISVARDRRVSTMDMTAGCAGVYAEQAGVGRRSRLPKGAVVAGFLAVVLCALAGCSSEGGVVGSGISSLQGNVIDVQLDTGTEEDAAETSGLGGAESELVPVLVSIADEELETLTDVDGYFSLDGEFSGAVGVRFSNPENGELLGTFLVDIALGATVFLRDVEIRRDLDLEDAVIVREPLHMNLGGAVTETDCADGWVVVVGDAPGSVAFTLRLTAAAELVDSDDRPLECRDLAVGTEVVLEEGVVLEDRTIDVVRLLVDPQRRQNIRKEIQVRRRGTVVRTECDRGQVLHLVDAQHRDLVRVELSRPTELVCSTEAACSCGDIGLGDVAEVHGVRHLVRPDTLVAEHVVIAPNPEPILRREFIGDVRNIDCVSGVATVVDVRLSDLLSGERPTDLLPVDVDLLPETKYQCGQRRGEACGCEDIGNRFRIQLEALIPIGGGPVQALNVTVLATPLIATSGEILTRDCAGGWMLIERQNGERLDVEIFPGTTIRQGNHDLLSCSDLGIEELVRVKGSLLDRPDLPLRVILAEEILIQGSPRSRVVNR